VTDSDRDAFLATYASIQAFYARDPSPMVAGMWWDLARNELTLSEFQAASMIHMRTNKFPPQLSEILDLARTAKWPSPEAAWNMAPKSEAESGWMCREIAAALASCQDSINRGDMIGARKAFLETYQAELRQVHGDPQWWISEASMGDYQSRMEAKSALLESAPYRRPALGQETAVMLECLTGIQRTGTGLSQSKLPEIAH
jgi:hypothetical protein